MLELKSTKGKYMDIVKICNKRSVNKDGGIHHKGESTKLPKEIKEFLKHKGFKVK